MRSEYWASGCLEGVEGTQTVSPEFMSLPFYSSIWQPGQRSGPQREGFGSAAVSSPSLSVGFNSSFINPATQPSIKLWLIQGHTTLSQGLQTLSSGIRLHQGLGQKGERRSQRAAFRLWGFDANAFNPIFCVPALAVTTIIISFAFSAILNKIPIINKWVVWHWLTLTKHPIKFII